MGVGLGENPPFDPAIDRRNINAVIGRHSQPIRWVPAEKCSCIGDNGRVDSSCKVCRGGGYTYEYITESFDIKEYKAEIDGYLAVSDVIWVRDSEGNEIAYESDECGIYSSSIKRGYYYNVKYIDSKILTGSQTAEKIDENTYRVNLPVQTKFGSVQGALISVTVEGKTVSNIYRNYFDVEGAEGDVVAQYEYIEPFDFALIHTNLSTEDQKFLIDTGGDALLIFPQRWEVSQYDFIVALNATMTDKSIITSTGDIDDLRSFYIAAVKSCYSIRDDKKHLFEVDTDFIIYQDDTIKWISDNRPEVKEKFSITYTYFSTYNVVKEVPSPRTSEYNRFPRKCSVKLYIGKNNRAVSV